MAFCEGLSARTNIHEKKGRRQYIKWKTVQESSNLQKGLGILVGEHLNIGTRIILLLKDYAQSLSKLV